MKKINLFLLIFIFASSIIFVYAQEDEKELEPPPGMEIIKIGSFNLLVPEGAQLRKKGSLIIVESTAEYAARKFLDMEERLAGVEAKEEEIRKEIEKLKEGLDEIQKDSLTPKENQ